MNLSAKVKKLVNLIESGGAITKDLKPVTVVGKITTSAQQLFPEDKDKDFLQIVQETYIKLLTKKGIESIKARQSWVVASGGDFEGYIRNHINQVLNPEGIVAIKGDRLKQLGKNSKKIQVLIRFLTLPAKRRCTQTSVDVWPDNDILVLTKVEDGVLHLKDDNHKMCFVAIDKIVVVWDARDEEHRAGFVSTPLNNRQ